MLGGDPLSAIARPSVRYRARPKTDTIVIHATHTDPRVDINIVAHMAKVGRDMGLLEIGCHAIIRKDGKLIECRPHTTMGSHTPHHNDHTLGVFLEGGQRMPEGEDKDYMLYPFDNFEDAQWDTLKFLWAYWQQFYGTLDLKAHSEYRRHGRPCPPLINRSIEDIRQWARPSS